MRMLPDWYQIKHRSHELKDIVLPLTILIDYTSYLATEGSEISNVKPIKWMYICLIYFEKFILNNYNIR